MRIRRTPITVALALSGCLALEALGVARMQAAPTLDCRCLENGGEPGPGDCPCDVLQCFSRCIDTLCPDTPECMLECSLRCSCNSAPSGCLTHVDPGPTPVPPTPGVKVGVCYSEIPGSSCSGVEAPFHSPVLEGPVPAAAPQTPTYDPSRYYYYHFDGVLPGNYILREYGCNPFGCWLDTPVRVADQDVDVMVQQLGPRTPAFRVCGKVGERPGENPPLARNVLVTLNPLGRSEFTTSSGIFCFEEVRPGSYTISVVEYVGAPSHCTEYGCWPDTPVTVLDANLLDLFVTMLALPTPTPTAPAPCLGDRNGDDRVTIEELVGAVNNALSGCPH